MDHAGHRPQLPPSRLTYPAGMTEAAEHTRTYVGGHPAADMPAAFPARIAGYTLVEPIGEGGMGTVWKAVQLETQRPVALKLMSAAVLASERARARFEREIALVKSLSHPHIAQVYEAGIAQGAYYYAMELIDGEPLDRYVRSRSLSRHAVMELTATVCRVMHYAHQRGIIHRDLKPSNILVTSDGSPKVLDLDLVRMSGIACGQRETLTGEIVGTPAFMAPEQARGESKALDTRTDVYALGATLYFLLTGATPHDTDGTLLEVLKRIAEQPPRPPRSFCPDLDAGLEAILLKALDPKSGARYPSAGEMASDIDRYLRGLPLAARRHSEWYVIRTWLVRIRRRIVIGAAAIHRLPLVIRAPWNRAVRKKVGPRATSERC